MSENAHLIGAKLQNKGQFSVGMSLARHNSMKQPISLRYLILVAGVLVAIVIAVAYWSHSVDFTAGNVAPSLPVEKLIKPPLVMAKVLVQKIAAIIF